MITSKIISCTFWLYNWSYSLEVQAGMCQKEEKMVEHHWQLKLDNCQLQPSTFLNSNRASLKEVYPWMTWWLFQVNQPQQSNCSYLYFIFLIPLRNEESNSWHTCRRAHSRVLPLLIFPKQNPQLQCNTRRRSYSAFILCSKLKEHMSHQK